MPPKRKPKQKLREITYKDTQNLQRSEQLSEPQTPIVIEIDHSRKRMSLNSSQRDSLVLVSDGALEKAAEDALEKEKNRRIKAAEHAIEAEAQEVHDNAVAKNRARQAYFELIKAQHAEREAQKAERQRFKDAYLFSHPDDQSVQSTQSTESTIHSDLDTDSLIPSLDPFCI
jgi:hypothetical protein